MRSRIARYWLLLLLLSIVGIVFFWPREPMYKGKPIGYWVDRACRYGAAKEMEEVKNIGPAAVPYLVERLRVSNRWRSTWLRVRARFPDSLKRHFPDGRSAQEIQYGATVTLQRFGAEAKPAVPDLIRLIPESGYAISALAAIGPDAKEALPALKAVWPRKNASDHARIAGALWSIGRETNFALRICTNLMIVPNDGALNAILLAGSMGANAAARAAPFALRLLQDTNLPAASRANAATVLGASRLTTEEIRAALLNGTREEGPLQWSGFLRNSCGLALWRLDSQYAPLGTRLAMQHLVGMKEQFPRQPHPNFVMWLDYRELDPLESVPTLKELLTSESAEMREAAADALQKIQATTSK